MTPRNHSATLFQPVRDAFLVVVGVVAESASALHSETDGYSPCPQSVGGCKSPFMHRWQPQLICRLTDWTLSRRDKGSEREREKWNKNEWRSKILKKKGMKEEENSRNCSITKNNSETDCKRLCRSHFCWLRCICGTFFCQSACCLWLA